jgi:hypothetical protein
MVCRLEWNPDKPEYHNHDREINWSTVSHDYRRIIDKDTNFAHVKIHGKTLHCDYYTVYDYDSKKLFPMWFDLNCHLKPLSNLD